MRKHFSKYFFLLFLWFCLSGTAISQTREIDSMKLLLKNQLADTTRLKVLDELSWHYLAYANEYDKAIEIAKEVLKLARKKGINTYDSPANSIIGSAYSSKGNHPMALKYLLRSLYAAEKQGDELRMAAAYTNIGNIYNTQKNTDEALKVYLKAKNIYEKKADNFRLPIIYNNIGIVLQRLKRLEEALSYYERAVELADQNGDISTKTDSYTNIANVYAAQKKHELALEYFLRVLEVKRALRNKSSIASTLINMGGVYADIGQLQKARTCLEEGKILAREIGHKEWLKNCYSQLERLERLSGNWKKAIKYKQLYVLYRDSLLSEENTRNILQQQFHYDFTKKRAQDSIVNAAHEKIETARHNKTIREQRLYTYFGIIGFILMLIVTVVSLRAYRQKRATNATILLQKSLVEKKQHEIIDSIRYAKRIQQAQLPSEKTVAKSLSRLIKKTG